MANFKNEFDEEYLYFIFVIINWQENNYRLITKENTNEYANLYNFIPKFTYLRNFTISEHY